MKISSYILLILFFLAGIIGYHYMYHTLLPEKIKWEIHFPISSFMALTSWVIVIIVTKSWSRIWKLLTYSALLTVLTDLASQFDQTYQQGNYVDYMAHAFGVTCCAAIYMYIGDKIIGKVKKWHKSHTKLFLAAYLMGLLALLLLLIYSIWG